MSNHLKGHPSFVDMVRTMEEGSVPSGYTIGLMTVAQAGQVPETSYQKGRRLFCEGIGSSSLWGACDNDSELPEVQRGWRDAYDAAAAQGE